MSCLLLHIHTLSVKLYVFSFVQDLIVLSIYCLYLLLANDVFQASCTFFFFFGGGKGILRSKSQIK